MVNCTIKRRPSISRRDTSFSLRHSSVNNRPRICIVRKINGFRELLQNVYNE